MSNSVAVGIDEEIFRRNSCECGWWDRISKRGNPLGALPGRSAGRLACPVNARLTTFHRMGFDPKLRRKDTSNSREREISAKNFCRRSICPDETLAFTASPIDDGILILDLNEVRSVRKA